MQDDPRSGKTKNANRREVNRVRTTVHSDQRLGVTLIAEELNMNRETVTQIITED
jgi:hypothetical protein